MAKVGVIGATTWGTTLAILLARQGADVRLLARTEDEAAKLNADGEHKRFVPGATFPSELVVTASPDEALSEADVTLLVVPSQTLRSNVRKIRDAFSASTVVVSCAKGLERGSSLRMSQVLEQELPDSLLPNICALSGPNLAREIIQGKPSSTVVASANQKAAEKAQAVISSPLFRVYTNDDIVGVEFGGTLKNVIAVGAGICDGLQYGDNSKAAFMTRGLAEVSRLGVAAGADPITFAGLAGMGDLFATCSSVLSRNHFVGEQLAQGKSLSEIRDSMQNVAEGVDTTAAASALAQKLGVEMPITEGMYNVLFKDVPLNEAIARLLGRAPRPEWTR